MKIQHRVNNVCCDYQEATPGASGERELSGDEGVSVTFETIKEDIPDGIRKRKEGSSSSQKEFTEGAFEGT